MAIDPNNLAGTAHLTFQDEFSSLSLWNGSSGTWDTDAAWDAVSGNGYSLSSNSEQEWYINSNYSGTSSVKPWTVSGGVLSLTAAPASAAIRPLIDNYLYTSGQLNTYHSFSQEYGFFEVNAKLPSGQGFWPAFWLMPENGSWPPELDVMEMLGNNTSTYYTTVHYNADNEYQSQAINAGVNLSAGYHTYGVDWEPDYITWYLDGKQVYKVATPADMNTPMYMILNLALGGSWPGDVDSSTKLPGAMQVNWVRVYAAGAAGSGTSTGSSSGSTSSGPGSGGSTAGHTLTAPNDNGTALTGGAGNDTLIASHGADSLTGGAGSDIFEFPVVPWSAGQITDFTPGTDKLDLLPLFQAAHYAGTDPVADGWLSLASDGKGDTLVYFNPHDGTNSGYPYLIATLDKVSPSSIVVSRDVMSGASAVSSSGSGANSGSTSSGSTSTGSAGGTGAAHTLTAPNDSGTTLTAGSGGYALIASHGPDILVAGSGPDIFEFPVIPWSAGQIRGFAPGTDKLDLAALFQAAHYAGTDPAADGWLSFASDGKGDTLVYFNPHDGTNSGYPYLITTLDKVSPSSIVESRDVIFGASTSAASTPTAGETLQAPTNNGSALTGGAGGDTLIASYGADVLTGGAGADTFRFPVIPWGAGHITDFTPGTDKLDLAALFQAAHYAGTNPVADGWLSFAADGKGDTLVYFNPHDGTNSGYPYLITTLDHLAPASLVESRDLIFS